MRVHPIKDAQKIAAIKKLLEYKPREYALFVIGLYTNLRASDILNLKIGQVKSLREGSSLVIKEIKTKKIRDEIYINAEVAEGLRRVLAVRNLQNPADDEFLFVRADKKPPHTKPLSRTHFTKFVKRWCAEAGLPEKNYGTHTLRKTFGYMNHRAGVNLALLMKAFNHSSQAMTLAYLGYEQEDLNELYKNTKY